MGSGGHIHAPAALFPAERGSFTHWIRV